MAEKTEKPEAQVESSNDQCIVELVNLQAQACGGYIALDPEQYPHLSALMQRVTGQGPILPVSAPQKAAGKGKGDE